MISPDYLPLLRGAALLSLLLICLGSAWALRTRRWGDLLMAWLVLPSFGLLLAALVCGWFVQ